MKRIMSRNNSISRIDKQSQMNKQEEIIARKRQEILEKHRTMILGKRVAAAQNVAGKSKSITNEDETGSPEALSTSEGKDLIDQTSTLSKIQNTFCNDGSFLTHFKKILENSEQKSCNVVEVKNQSDENVLLMEDESAKVVENTTINYNEEIVNSSNAFVYSPSICNNPLPEMYNTNSISGSLEMPPVISIPMQNSYPDNHLNTFYNPVTIIGIPPPPPPPALLPPSASSQGTSQSLYLNPTQEMLQQHTTPYPKQLELNPELYNTEHVLNDISTTVNERVFSGNSDSITIPTTIETLIDLVAEFGDEYEDKVRKRKNDVHPSLWFLFEKDSEKYLNYRAIIEANRRKNFQEIHLKSYQRKRHSSTSHDDKYDPESVIDFHDHDSDEEYMKGMMNRNRNNLKRRIECRNELSDEERAEREAEDLARQKKRKSRWGDKVADSDNSSVNAMVSTSFANQNKPMLSNIQRTDPALLQYARLNYGTTNLSNEDWKKCEEHFKVNLLYQDMMRKREEIDNLARSGKFKYEYDSDEDVNGGTWEHKLRNAEMEATQAWAQALTKQSEGKHHIGDFLPPEELKKFMEQYEAKKNNRLPDLSDYKEYKLKEDNIGFQMLQKLGWKEGQGLGSEGLGIIDPVNKAPQRDGNQGLGVNNSATPEECDNEYEAYRKRMMLAYRFRPNPLNNPRRAYY